MKSLINQSLAIFVMRWLVCLLVLLSACSYFSDVSSNVSDASNLSNESLITGGVIVDVLPGSQNETNVSNERTDIIVEPVNDTSNDIVSVWDLNETTEEFVEIPKDYTIGEVHSLTPKLEDAVESSVCYSYTWTGIESYEESRKLKVAKSVRFSYLGAGLFKGWILSTLTDINKKVIASKNVQVLVNDMQVTCVDEGNFTIDWESVIK